MSAFEYYANRALWKQAEQDAESLLEHEDTAICIALDRAVEHEHAVKQGVPSDNAWSSELFVEGCTDPAGARDHAARVVAVLRAWLWG